MTEYPVPTRSDLRVEARADVVAALEGLSSPLPFSEERAHADAQAGLVSGLYGFLQFIARQLLPDSSQGVWLWRHADLWLRRGRKEASRSSGHVLVRGLPGSSLPTGALLNAPTGDFEVLTGVSIDQAGVATVNLRAVRAGPGGNLLKGARLRFVGTYQGINPEASVISPGFSGGANRETEEDARARIRERIQAPPHGGADFDYIAWAKEVPGCTRAWAVGNEMGIGTVTVRVMFDETRADNNGFPLASDLDLVRTNIENQRPVTAKQFFVVSPDPLPVNVQVLELIGDSPELRARILENLRRVVRLRAAPGERLLASFLSEAISKAAGEDGHRSTIGDVLPKNQGSLPFIAGVKYD